MSEHVNSPMADLFYDQCLGDSAGNSSFNPLIY